MGLEQNRVYDIGQIEILRQTATELLGTGIASCTTWDMAVEELGSILSGTPIKCAELGRALASATQKLNRPEYETDKYKVDGILYNVISRIPQQDMEGTRALEPLAENLHLLMGMTEDLEGCIKAAGTSLALAEFQQKLEGIKKEWDDDILEDRLQAMETIMLGLPRGVSYSADIFKVVNNTMDSHELTWEDVLQRGWIKDALVLKAIGYSKLIEKGLKDAEEIIKGFIPQQIDNDVVLFAYDALRKVTNIPDEVIKKNSTDNLAVLQSDGSPLPESGYIENQSEWTMVKFGCGSNATINYSGCGIIATYNALYDLGESVSAQTMVDIISYYERDGAAISGMFGVAPNAIENYFRKNGYKVEATTDRDAEIINRIGQEYETVIVTAYNDKEDIWEQLHTVSITTEYNGEYTIHNVYPQNTDVHTGKYGYATLQEAIENISEQKPAVINVIGISNAN